MGGFGVSQLSCSRRMRGLLKRYRRDGRSGTCAMGVRVHARWAFGCMRDGREIAIEIAIEIDR
eukprot:6199393-Pleurochrysis_carterae.AAC.1